MSSDSEDNDRRYANRRSRADEEDRVDEFGRDISRRYDGDRKSEERTRSRSRSVEATPSMALEEDKPQYDSNDRYSQSRFGRYNDNRNNRPYNRYNRNQYNDKDSVEKSDPEIPQIYLDDIDPKQTFKDFVLNANDSQDPFALAKEYVDYVKVYDTKLSSTFFTYAKNFEFFQELYSIVKQDKLKEQNNKIAQIRANDIIEGIKHNALEILLPETKYVGPVEEPSSEATPAAPVDPQSFENHLNSIVIIDSIDSYFTRLDFSTFLEDIPDSQHGLLYTTYGDALRRSPSLLNRPIYLFYENPTLAKDAALSIGGKNINYKNKNMNEFVKDKNDYSSRLDIGFSLRCSVYRPADIYTIIPMEANRESRLTADIEKAKKLITLMDQDKGISSDFLSILENVRCHDEPLDNTYLMDLLRYYLRNVHNFEYYEGKEFKEYGALIQTIGKDMKRSTITPTDEDAVDSGWCEQLDKSIEECIKRYESINSEEGKQKKQEQIQKEQDILTKTGEEQLYKLCCVTTATEPAKCPFGDKRFENISYIPKHFLAKHKQDIYLFEGSFAQVLTDLYYDEYMADEHKKLPLILNRRHNYTNNNNNNNYNNNRNGNQRNYYQNNYNRSYNNNNNNNYQRRNEQPSRREDYPASSAPTRPQDLNSIYDF
ncbi:hypothetical protein WA158_001636 [Blastocystis sp. Blastoise]